MNISIVIPVKDEEESLPIFYKQLMLVLQKLRKPYEIIFIDDGSIDRSWQIMQNLKKKDRNITVVKFRANFGKSAALAVGFELATGDVVITLDADLQDDPKEIPAFLRKLSEGYNFILTSPLSLQKTT